MAIRQYCKCGCGGRVNPGNTWIIGHHLIGKSRPDLVEHCRQLGLASAGKSRPDLVEHCRELGLASVGKNHANYVDGYTQKINKWKLAVYERDNYTCQICGHKGEPGVKIGNIQAHHIKPKETFPEFTFHIKNGACLCASCHRKLHRVAETSPERTTWGRAIAYWKRQLKKVFREEQTLALA